MIFTAGKTHYYRKVFQKMRETNQHPMKAGRDVHKVGGSVWKTIAESQHYCNHRRGMSVFGVLADWESDTAPTLTDEGWGWRDLLKSSPLVELNPTLFDPTWVSDPWNPQEIKEELGIEITQSGLYMVDNDSVLVVPAGNFLPGEVWNQSKGEFLCYVYKGGCPMGAFQLLAEAPLRKVIV